MNPDVGRQPAQPPLSEAAKSALAMTTRLFRIFLATVLGSFFVFSLDVNYVWLTALLTVASGVVGVVVLVRAVKLKQSRLILFGTISGLVVSVIMSLLLLTTVLFFNQIRGYQDCTRAALTEAAKNQCQSDLEKSLPTQLR